MNQMLKNNRGLVDYCKAQLGRPYWYGTFGQLATEDLYNRKKKSYPNKYTADDYKNQFGKKVHDCVGLIKGYFWTKNADSTEYEYQSNGMKDISADSLLSICENKSNDMDKMPHIPGIAVFMKGHVGIYIGGCWVIEARGHSYGVVKTKLCQRNWKSWAYIEGLQYLDKE